MSCSDGPPLACNETGCPAPIINCSFLAANNACELPIEKIWEQSTPMAHPMPVWMYCGISCKQCGSDTLTDVDLDRIAQHDGPATAGHVWGLAGNQVNSGSRHAAVYGEFMEARRTCDAERLWRPAGGDESQFNHDYMYHESVNDLDCPKPLPTPAESSWAQYMRTRLAAIRRGVERSAPESAAPSDSRRVPFWLRAIRMQKLLGYGSYSKFFRCAQRVHTETVRDYPRSMPPSSAPKLLRCTVAARGGGAGTHELPFNWTFTRAGPFVGHGGYDWHTTLWKCCVESGCLGRMRHNSPHRPPRAVSVSSGLLSTPRGSLRATQRPLRGCGAATRAVPRSPISCFIPGGATRWGRTCRGTRKGAPPPPT